MPVTEPEPVDEEQAYYRVAPGYYVLAFEHEIDTVNGLAEAFDSLAFWWPVSTGGFVIGLLPRKLWEGPTA